jgi:hypothetical protein
LSVPTPTLSVVIPYFRGSDTIRAAVESVLAQSVRAFEIVICDDGSPDDLESALGQLIDEVLIVRKPNGGIASAMNATTDAASGELLVQLDQDDAFLPRRLQAIAEAAVAHPDADVIATDAVVEYGGEPVVRLGAVHPFQERDQRRAIINSCFFLWPAIRRSRLLAVGGYDESFSVMQDWECFIRLLLDGARVAYVDEPLYRWRLTPGSRSSSDGIANGEALVRMMEKTLARADLSAAEREEAERALASHRRRLALERSQHAIETGSPTARRKSIALVTGEGFPTSTRAKAAVAALSPRLARLLIAQRRERAPAADALARRGFPRPR